MTSNDQSRRERIMNSQSQLPGDKARAEAEENADFDAMDTGNFSEQRIEGSKTDSQREQQVNQSSGQLPGDAQRGADDRRIDEGGNNTSGKVADANPNASKGPNDSAVTGGQATGGGTPQGGSENAGIDNSSSSETEMARGAFGGSTTGYGQSAPSLSAQDLGNALDDGTKTGGKTVDG